VSQKLSKNTSDLCALTSSGSSEAFIFLSFATAYPSSPITDPEFELRALEDFAGLTFSS
jgi:hypothetical protein